MGVEVVREGWRAHYERMQRSYAKLATHNAPPFVMVFYEDDLYHFFQDAWHLKDWLINDPAANVRRKGIEADLENGDRAFKITADLANGTKHRALTTKNKNTKKVSRIGAVIVERIRSVPITGGKSENRWRVRLADGTETTAEKAAKDVMKAWDKLLKSYGLI
jgi:hypothetical protein